MTELSMFFKQNKAAKTNTKYAVTKNFTDKKGRPLEWEIKPITTREDEAIREACTVKVPVPGKPHLTTSELNNNKYIAKMLAASVVSPDLQNAELQDSYGVKMPEDLLREMVDSSAEYMAFVLFVQKFNGMDVSFAESEDIAKN